MSYWLGVPFTRSQFLRGVGSPFREDGVAPTVPVITEETVDFGAKTLINSGDYGLTASGSPTSWAITGGTAQSDYNIDNSGVITSAVANPSGGTLTVTATNAFGTSSPATITISSVANAYSVAPSASETQLELSTEDVSLALDDKILLRSGDYNSAFADIRTRRSTAPTGTFNGTNYVVIEPHTGATPSIYRWSFTNVNGGTKYFKIEGVTLQGTNDGSFGGSASGIIACLSDCEYIGINNCTIQSPSTTPDQAQNLPVGFRADSSAHDNLFMTNCTVDTVYNGVTIQGTNSLVSGNNLSTIWNDGIRLVAPCTDSEISWNTVTDKKYPHTDYAVTNITKGTETIVEIGAHSVNPGDDCILFDVVGMTEINGIGPVNVNSVTATTITININSTGFSDYVSGGDAQTSSFHGDFIQGRLIGAAGEQDNIQILGNLLYRGDGETGWPDGQGIFMADSTVDVDGMVIEGNMILCSFVNGIYINRPTNAVIRNNICLSDYSLYPSTNTAVRLATSGSGNTLHNTMYNNLIDDTTGLNTNNNVMTTNSQATYEAYFDDPQSGSSVTDFETMYSIKVGSVPDLLDPKAGAAGTGYIDYDNQTINIPAGQVLTSATGTATGQTTADLSVDTTVGTGTLYWVVTQSTTTPSIAQIKAGQDHTGSAADDSGNQSVTMTGTQNTSSTGLTADTTYYSYFVQNDGVDDSNIASSPSFKTSAATYTQNLVNFPGTAYITGGSTAIPDDNQLTFSAWVNPDALIGSRAVLYFVSGRSEIFRDNDDLSVRLENTSNTVIANFTTTGGNLTAGSLHHVHVRADAATGDLEVTIDGILESTTFTSGQGPIENTRNIGLMASNTSAFPWTGDVGDYYFAAGEYRPSSQFESGGNPIDISGFATGGEIYLGGTMVAADWNSSTNLGISTITMNGTVTDA